LCSRRWAEARGGVRIPAGSAEEHKVLGLLAVIQLEHGGRGELVEGSLEVVLAPDVGVLVHELGDFAKGGEIINHDLFDVGPLDLDDDLLPFVEDGAVHLPQGGGGEGFSSNSMKARLSLTPSSEVMVFSISWKGTGLTSSWSRLRAVR
jgi:hypothetical protein